jgi:glucose-6-phosphate-specific signal transduction histidine kinase
LRIAAATLGVPARVHVEASAASRPEVAGTLYFCCLRVLEHLGAGSKATVTVREEKGTIVFEIVQDGPGVANATADLIAAQDRVDALGGRLAIVSEPGNGIRVSGSLPL